MQIVTDTRVSRHYWWLLGIRGLAAVLFGLAAILWPGLTLFVLVIFFGAYALVDGVMAVTVSFQERRYFRQWWVLLIGGLLGVAVGVMTFLWPAITALVLLYLIASWAMVTGLFEIAVAFSGWLPGAYRWTLALAGVLSSVWRDPGSPTWGRTLVPHMVDRDLCHRVRSPSYHPCFSVQAHFLESCWCDLNR